MSNETYGAAFFDTLGGSFASAQRILPPLLHLLEANTVVDVGCGIGAWARAARDLGCRVKGLDGDWVPRDRLLIAVDEFETTDLTRPLVRNDSYDLAICVEVGEHLPEVCASALIKMLTRLAPAVLFSAAVPCQRGSGHVNEQLPSYWVQLFEAEGFRPHDILRPQHWNDQSIEFFYRQNMLLMVSADNLAMCRAVAAVPSGGMLDVIHPAAVPILAQGWVEAGGVVRCLSLLRRTLKIALRKRWSRIAAAHGR